MVKNCLLIECDWFVVESICTCKCSECSRSSKQGGFGEAELYPKLSNGVDSAAILNRQDKKEPRRCKGWKPLLLTIPLRLGLSDVNPVYINSLKVLIILNNTKKGPFKAECVTTSGTSWRGGGGGPNYH